MNNRFLIHDLDEQDAAKYLDHLPKDTSVFPAKPKVKHCIGCFGCWLKTPGICIFSDRVQVTPAYLAKSNEMTIISRNLYGGFSPETKAVLDRSIGYLMPYFRIINKEMHHVMRYDNPFKLTVHFYGPNIDAKQQTIAQQLILANAINLGAGSHEIYYHETLASIKEVL